MAASVCGSTARCLHPHYGKLIHTPQQAQRHGTHPVAHRKQNGYNMRPSVWFHTDVFNAILSYKEITHPFTPRPLQRHTALSKLYLRTRRRQKRWPSHANNSHNRGLTTHLVGIWHNYQCASFSCFYIPKKFHFCRKRLQEATMRFPNSNSAPYFFAPVPNKQKHTEPTNHAVKCKNTLNYAMPRFTFCHV